ncbi:MAG: YiiD C-terminal domain-containing protein, partial [Gemmatimonadetes bacterium]|nr:YiiD C-terminal domain-containing protein [Gemmatimonadota bacterium]
RPADRTVPMTRSTEPAATESAEAYLQATWHREIPITAPMGLEVVAFDGSALHIRAGLDENRNVHGTGFAGSLYAISALAGWGLLHLVMRAAGEANSIVIADGRIRYHKPVTTDIDARCSVADDPAFADGLARFRETGRARFDLRATIGDPSSPLAEFEGTYAVIRPKSGH